MTSVNVSAFAQLETVIEKVFREVFTSDKDGCRFTVEVRLPNGVKQYHSLYSVSKIAAQQEAEERISSLFEQVQYARIAWRIIGDSKQSAWSLSSDTQPVSKQVSLKEKGESLWSRFFNYFFLDEEEM